MTPSATFSSRWFSIAMTAQQPSGLIFTESGWPPRSTVRTIERDATSTTTNRPACGPKVSSARTGVSSTSTSAYRPCTATEVGEPPTATLPAAAGRDGSRRSTNPSRPAPASV